MDFEFDASKSEANKVKHGVNFHQARKLWEDPDALEYLARTEGESRKLLIARMDGRHWAVIFTERGDRIRIISARRARKKEVESYEQATTSDDDRES